jgi:hypothetical protein
LIFFAPVALKIKRLTNVIPSESCYNTAQVSARRIKEILGLPPWLAHVSNRNVMVSGAQEKKQHPD